MNLSTKELNKVLELLSEEQLSCLTLEAVSASFHRDFFTRQDHFRVGMALVLLLQQRDLLPLSAQRVTAMFLLYEFYRSDPPAANPFSQLFVELLQPAVEDDRSAMGLPCGHALSPVEKWFLAQLLSPSPPRDLFKRTPISIATLDPASIQPPDVSAVVASLQGHPASLVGLPSIISDPDPTGKINFSVASQTAETVICGAYQLMEQPFEPGFIRPLPPLYSCSDEVMWMNPTESKFSVQWDEQMCRMGPTEARKMFARACKEALTIPEQQMLSAQFEEDPKLVHQVGLTPQKLPQLVEKNPTVAIEALLKLTSSSHISEYFAALINMDMSLHSMEVVNRLTSAVDLPTEFLHLYIINCIEHCRSMADKSMQSRLVRLVCVFLQSLIRNKIINVQDDFVEIQTFSLEYSKIREATALYRLLKTMESGGEGPAK